MHWPQLTDTSQPCTATSMAPVIATTLVVSRWSPTATGSCPPRTSAHARNMAAARSASAVLSTGPAIAPAGAPPVGPSPTERAPRPSVSASNESPRWSSSRPRSQPAHGVGPGSSCGVAPSAAANAYRTAHSSSRYSVCTLPHLGWLPSGLHGDGARRHSYRPPGQPNFTAAGPVI
jgi:hypothetical protein